MDFQCKNAQVASAKTDALILAVYEDKTLGSAAQAVDSASNGAISAVLKHGDISGKAGETLLLQALPGCPAKRIVLTGFGKHGETSDSQFRKAMAAAFAVVKGTAAKDAALDLAELVVKERDTQWLTRQIVELAEAATYTFNQYKSKDNQKKVPFAKLLLCVADKASEKETASAITTARAIAAGMSYTRDLGNLPPTSARPPIWQKKRRNLPRPLKSWQ